MNEYGKPLGNRLLIKRDEGEETYKGLVIPDVAKEKAQTGTVVEIGYDVKEVRRDDRVIFGKYNGTEIILNTEQLLIVREDEILLVLPE